MRLQPRYVAPVLLVAIVGLATLAAPAGQRTYSPDVTELMMGGASAGFVGYEGCRPFAPVVATSNGSGVKKQLGPLEYEPCVLLVRAGMTPAFYAWIASAMAGDHVAKRVELRTVDHTGAVRQSLQLQDAIVTRVTFPEFNGMSKDTATVRVELAPSAVVLQGAGGTSALALSKTKAPLLSSFKVTLDGAHVASAAAIGPVDVRMPGVSARAVEGSPATPSAADPQPFRFTVGGTKLSPAHAWLEGFLLQTQHTDADEATLVLEARDPTLSTVMYTVTLEGVGVLGGDIYFANASSTQPPSWRSFELYAEKATLHPAPSWS